MSAIVERMGAHLSKKITWFERMIDELVHVQEELLTDATEELFEKQQVHLKALEELEAESRGLYEQWEQTHSIPEDDRNEMRRRARHAEDLSQKLQALVHKGAAIADARAAAVAKNLAALGRGRNLLSGYRPTDAPPSTRVDRDA